LADGRKNNGGHSTKAKNPNDKRLTTKAEAIQKAETMDSVGSLKEAYQKVWDLCQEGDFNALKFWIEQRAGKATETKELTVNSEQIMGLVIKGAKGNINK
jgi:hypothetical protein